MSSIHAAELENLIVNFPQGPRRKSYHHQPANQNQVSVSHLNLQLTQQTKQTKQLKVQSRPQEKRLRFVEVCTIHRDNFNSDDGELEPSSTWYSQSDYKIFRATIKSDIRAMRQAMSGHIEIDPNQEHVFAGIEQLASKDIVMRTIKYRIAHKDAVLGEYRRQEASGIVDLKRLRNASNSFSKLGKVKALILAGNTEEDQE